MSRRESMSRRAVPYPDDGALIVVPREVWRRTVDELRVYAPVRSEALVFWGGIASGHSIHVTGLYLLKHAPQGGCVRLTKEESRWLLRTLRDRDEKLLGQVHSHPDTAFHSPGDDERAASFHRGYLSIVAPRFAMQVRDIADCAVFEFNGREFQELSATDVSARVKLTSLFEERAIARSPIPQHERSAGWLITIVSKLKAKLTGRQRR